MSAIPDGLPPAVAVRICVPAVEGASERPAILTHGRVLSTYTVSVRERPTRAAFEADILTVIAPSPAPPGLCALAVSRSAFQLRFGHCCQESVLTRSEGPGSVSSPRATEIRHAP